MTLKFETLIIINNRPLGQIIMMKSAGMRGYDSALTFQLINLHSMCFPIQTHKNTTGVGTEGKKCGDTISTQAKGHDISRWLASNSHSTV